MKILSKIAVPLFATGALFLASCEVEQVEEGELPDVDVEVKDEGNLPKYDVDAPDVDVRMEEKTIDVPEVDVRTEEKTIEVPDIDVTVPEDRDEPETVAPENEEVLEEPIVPEENRADQ